MRGSAVAVGRGVGTPEFATTVSEAVALVQTGFAWGMG